MAGAAVLGLRRGYGPGALQYGDLYPGEASRRRTMVVVLHGGFWRPHRTLEMTAPIAQDLARRGWSAWNVEYRRVGQGNWPATLEDSAAALDHVAALAGELSLDLRRVLVLGHSAGGQLAVWSAGRSGEASRRGRPEPAIRVDGVVSLAGVLDLDRAARTHVGDDAVAGFTGGGPDELPDRYREADPTARLPTGVKVRCVHSRTDERVPFEQSLRYVDAARRVGDDAQLVEVSGSHTDAIDVGKPAWQTVLDVLGALDGD